MKFFYQEHSKSPGIYKIINTHSNRIYIGQAARFEKRWYDHKRYLLGGRHQNKFLLNDFNKCKEILGNDDFLEFYVLEIMENSTKEQRNKREEEEIAKYFDKQENCYNFKQKTIAKERSCYSNTPEETRKLISENSKIMWANRSIEEKKQFTVKMTSSRTLETYKKISKAHKGKIISEEEKIRLRLLGKTGPENPRFGKPNKWGHHTPEAIEKIRQTSTGRKKSQSTLEKTSGKNHWTKKTGGHSEETKKKISATRIKKPIFAKNINTEQIIEFESITKAANELKIFKSNIKNVLLGKQHKAKGYYFSFSSKDIKNTPTKSHKNKGKHCSTETKEKMLSSSKTKKPIIAINIITGEEKLFPSLKNASTILNVAKIRISEILKGKQHQSKGWTFKRPT